MISPRGSFDYLGGGKFGSGKSVGRTPLAKPYMTHSSA